MRILVPQSLQNIADKIARTRRVLIAIPLIALLFIPRSSESQILPSPCCAILSVGLGSISSAISDVIGGALNAINATMSSIQLFEQTVVWPQDLIQQAKNAVGAFENVFNQIQGLAHLPVRSATLPATRQLEQTLLSGDTNRIDSIDLQYTAVYSAVPQAPDATPEVRDLVDMTDATAEAAMKRAIQIDAIADLEMQAADQMIHEIQAAAPGSAPILEAGADAWLVRANAYTQTALTELMRLRAVDLAGQAGEMKLDSERAAKLRGNLTNSLKRN
jgi:hypothetical protein